MKRFLPYLLPALLLNLAGLYSFHASRQQDLLLRQLEQSVSVLATENAHVLHDTQNELRGMEDAVAKNHSQPADVARQRQAESWHAQVTAALDSLHAQAALLRRRTGNPAAPAPLRVPGSEPFRAVDGPPPTRRWRALGRQLTTCAATLPQLAAPTAGPRPTLPAPPAATTTIEALADLAQVENQLLTRENCALHHVAQALARNTWLATPIALATADHHVVAPGGTYRARLLVVTHYGSNLRLRMACNGQPIAVDAAGVGQVRFRAPRRPGPASWTGTVRLGINDRDTTFVVRVPYRVARP